MSSGLTCGFWKLMSGSELLLMKALNLLSLFFSVSFFFVWMLTGVLYRML
jgi:hypothetical protein